MSRLSLTLAGVLTATLMVPNSSDAGIGTLLRKGIGWVSQRSGKAASKSVRTGVKQAGARVVPVASSAGKASARALGGGGRETGKQLLTRGTKVVTQAASPAPVTVLSRLGVEGSQAAANLSPRALQKLAAVSGDLARSPHRQGWLKLLRESGDEVADFLWQRKSSIAVGAVATAAILHPDDFLAAGEGVALATVEAVGVHIAEPLVVRTAEHVAAPVGRELAIRAAESFPWQFVWWASISSVMGCAVLWCRRRRNRVRA